MRDCVRQFRAFYADKDVFESRNLNCKLIDVNKLRSEDRWDIDRFWSDKERLELGLSEEMAMGLDQFELSLSLVIESIKNEIEDLKGEAKKTSINYIEISLGDQNYFDFCRGKRVTKKDIHNNPGNIPVISSGHEKDSYLGYISENWLLNNENPIFDESLVTVNMDGSVGDVFLRNEPKYTINDVVIAIEIKNRKLYPLYIVYAIKEAVAKAQFKYDAKLYQKRLKKLKIRIPIADNGDFDIEEQQLLALQYEKLEELKHSVKHFADELEDKFITTDILMDQ